MYDGWTALVIVFLTHLATMYLPSSGIVFSWMRGLFQAGIVLAMHSTSEGKPTTSIAFELLYWAILGLWAWIKIKIALHAAQ